MEHVPAVATWSPGKASVHRASQVLHSLSTNTPWLGCWGHMPTLTDQNPWEEIGQAHNVDEAGITCWRVSVR